MADAAEVPGLGALESAVMLVLWDTAPRRLTIREIHETVGWDNSRSSVATILANLGVKGLVARDRGGRAGFLYSATGTRDTYLAGIVRRALDVAVDQRTVLELAWRPELRL